MMSPAKFRAATTILSLLAGAIIASGARAAADEERAEAARRGGSSSSSSSFSQSSSSSSSSSTGNAVPPPGFPPNAFQPPPGFPSPPPLGARLYGPGRTSFSSSSSSISLDNIDVVSALSQVANTTGASIRLTPRAAAILVESGKKVTLSERNATLDALAAKILADTGLTGRLIEGFLLVAAPEEEIDPAKLVSIQDFALGRALDANVTLVMVQTPVPFVTQMLSGMTGAPIDLPARYRDPFFVAQPIVTVEANGVPLRKVLESIARQLNADLVIKDGRVSFELKATRI